MVGTHKVALAVLAKSVLERTVGVVPGLFWPLRLVEESCGEWVSLGGQAV